jgi:hypothetical protein
LPAVGADSPTLPPPPFEQEVEVASLAWWLDSHMKLASELLVLEQLVEGAPTKVALHVAAMRCVAEEVESVRDALYELYCDAADPRMAPLLASGTPFETHIRALYKWCDAVVEVLRVVASGIRAGSADWPSVKAAASAAIASFVGTPTELRSAIEALPIELSSPVEPLRNLRVDVNGMSEAAERLFLSLERRFG